MLEKKIHTHGHIIYTYILLTCFFHFCGEKSPRDPLITLTSISLGLAFLQRGLSQTPLQLDKSSYAAVAAVMVPWTLREMSDL